MRGSNPQSPASCESESCRGRRSLRVSLREGTRYRTLALHYLTISSPDMQATFHSGELCDLASWRMLWARGKRERVDRGLFEVTRTWLAS